MFFFKNNKDKLANKENIMTNESVNLNRVDKLIMFSKNSNLGYSDEQIKNIINKLSIWYELKYIKLNSEDLYSDELFYKYLSNDEFEMIDYPKYRWRTTIDILNDDNELDENIKYYNNLSYFKEELFRCVCDKLLENHSGINGMYRCVLFINNFDVEIDEKLFDKLIKKDGITIMNMYFNSKTISSHKVNIDGKNIIVNNNYLIDLLKKYNYDVKYYPIEEYIKLTKALKSGINQDKLKNEIEIKEKENIKQLRIQRKLNK